MTLTRRKVATVLLTLGVTVAGLGLSGCGYATPASDQIGLYYNQGWYEGKNFDHVVRPGVSDDTFAFNDTVIYLPTGVLPWDVGGADRPDPFVVSSLPRNGEPSGVLVKVWPQVNMKLNTNDDDIPGYKGGTIRRFWEDLGQRYGADDKKGWVEMMKVTVANALERGIQDVSRFYDADILVNNVGGVWTEMQNRVAAQFQQYLERMSGGKFFCGPSFDANAAGNPCPPVELLIKNIDYDNLAVQASRDEKRIALEKGAAKQAEADALVAAQAKLNIALRDPNYVKLIEIQTWERVMTECAKNQGCVMIASGGAVNVNVGPK